MKKGKILATVISLVFALSGIFMIFNASVSGISNKPDYTEYYKKAESNLKQKRFVDVTVGHPSFFGLSNTYDDYSYYCKSNEAVRELKSQILNKKQLPTTNSNYILYNDEGKVVTSSSTSYPSSYIFTVHKPKDGQTIVNETKNSQAYQYYVTLNKIIQCVQWSLVAILICVELYALSHIWIWEPNMKEKEC